MLCHKVENRLADASTARDDSATTWTCAGRALGRAAAHRNKKSHPQPPGASE